MSADGSKGNSHAIPFPKLLAEIFTELLGVPVDHTDLGLTASAGAPIPETVHIPWLLTRTVNALNSSVKGDLMLDHHNDDPAGLSTGSELLTALHPWAAATPDPLLNVVAEGHGRIGTADVAQIEHATTVFRTWDNAHGGGPAREAIVGQLKAAVALLDGPYTEAVGRALFRAVADLASVAGWASFDAGLHTTAQRYFVLGLHAAKEAGDPTLGAHILNCMSRQMGHLNRPTDALDLVKLAQYGARNTATATTHAMLHALEARYQAVLGRTRELHNAIALAEDAFAHTSPTEDPSGSTSSTPASSTPPSASATRSRPTKIPDTLPRRPGCWSTRLTTAPPTVSVPALSTTLPSRTLLLCADYEGASTATRAALAFLDDLGSRRVKDRLRELQKEANRLPTNGVLGDMNDQLGAVLTDP